MKATWQIGIVQLGVLVVGGCDKSAVEPDDPITEEEAAALFWGASVEQLLEDSTRIVEVRGDTVETSCEYAGTATVVITHTSEVVGGGLRQSSLFETDHLDCEFEWEGFRFLVAEGSSMDHLIGANIAGATFEMFGEVTASLEWSLADRTGTCDVDLAIEGVLDLSDPANPVGNPWPHYGGTVCGHEVEYDIEYEFVEDFEMNQPWPVGRDGGRSRAG